MVEAQGCGKGTVCTYVCVRACLCASTRLPAAEQGPRVSRSRTGRTTSTCVARPRPSLCRRTMSTSPRASWRRCPCETLRPRPWRVRGLRRGENLLVKSPTDSQGPARPLWGGHCSGPRAVRACSCHPRESRNKAWPCPSVCMPLLHPPAPHLLVGTASHTLPRDALLAGTSPLAPPGISRHL